MGDLTRDFSLSELRCRCPRCAALEHPPVPTMGLLLKLQAIRDDFGKPIVVTCGIRCPEHNREEGGAPDSRHLPVFGDAVDIACADSGDRFRLVAAAIKAGIRFIEVCDAHLHFDDRPSTPKLILGDDH